MKALLQWQIEDCRKQHNEGKSYYQLAKQYNCHPRTIENLLRVDKKVPEREESGISIKVITIVPGKTLNFMGVTKIDKGRDWVRILKDNDVIGLLEAQNITAIVPI